MGLCLAAVWLAFARAWTNDSLIASLYIGAAGALAGGAALLAARWVRRRPWSARFSAAFLILVVGTVGLTSFFLMLRQVFAAHDLSEIPLRWAAMIVTISTLAALYNFLTVVGLVILPLGLPVITLFACLIARNAR